ncbi:hypothetical protein [Nonomuraea rubra]
MSILSTLSLATNFLPSAVSNWASPRWSGLLGTVAAASTTRKT